MLWFSYQNKEWMAVAYVNLANFFVKFNHEGHAKLFDSNDEALIVDRPEDVARLRNLLDVEIRLQRLIVLPEGQR